VTGVTFHGLRHTHITNLLRGNVHPKIASERAGHSSVAITLDVYSHAVPNMQADAALLVDANIRGILGS
jgi:integrase